MGKPRPGSHAPLPKSVPRTVPRAFGSGAPSGVVCAVEVVKRVSSQTWACSDVHPNSQSLTHL